MEKIIIDGLECIEILNSCILVIGIKYNILWEKLFKITTFLN